MWPFIKPHWFKALLAIFITIPIGSLDAVIALSLKPYMDLVVVDKSIQSPYYIPVLIILFTLIQSGLEYGATYLNTWVGAKITMGLKAKLYDKLLEFEPSYFDANSSGNIAYRFDADPTQACSGLLNNIKTFTSRLFSSLSLIGVLLYNSWQLAIIAIGVLMISLYPLTKIRKKIKALAKEIVFAGGEALTVLNESCLGNKTITAYNLEGYQKGKFNRVLKSLFRLTIKQTQRTAWLSPMMHVIISLGIAGVIWFGSVLIMDSTITSGSFVSFMTAMLMLYNPIKNIGKNFSAVQLSFLAIERIFEILEREPTLKDKKDAKVISGVKKGITFENVTFAYKEGKNVLENINLSIPKGKTVAFVGNSGGGKTTTVNLVPRFYDVSIGAIKIDGNDVRDLTLESLHNQIAVVFQDNFLFSGTIRENILLGKQDATDEEIEQALKSACLDEFVRDLPNGLDTNIGERGTLLSGVQKQRVAIARAFIKNAPIVILDEATSALDNKSEAIVQKAIDNLMKDRTVMVIAHRLSTIQNADKIVVINEGRIVEEGTHEELLEKEEGAYRTLYMAQFKPK
ncbi:MAG: ABC transporter ATP-binding protein [Alphaproteobacteria bacterium]|nr:ABC transporter ATP-binding protein [Alphaproteobacteria bacterium]